MSTTAGTPAQQSATAPPGRAEPADEPAAPSPRRRRRWSEYPWPVGTAMTLKTRARLARNNLFDSYAPGERDVRPPARLARHRSYDGTGTDTRDEGMGARGTRFGRNMPPHTTVPEAPPRLLTPNPRDVSRALLTRGEFIPSPKLNMLAAAWLQFQIHGWIDHGPNVTDDPIEVELRDGDSWPSCPMSVRRTRLDLAATSEKSGSFVNLTSHWWDGSQIYGSTEARCRSLRTGEDGKLALENGRLPDETELGMTGIDQTGAADNYWAGLSIMHTLFAKEHNSICDRLKAAYPHRDDEWLFQIARLVNTALIARIHLMEWTPAIIDCPALHHGGPLLANGLLPRAITSRVRPGGRLSRMIALTGAYGSHVDHEGVPFSLTEEFAFCYRLHPMVRDEYPIYSAASRQVMDVVGFNDLQARATRGFIDRFGMDHVVYSFGRLRCGDNTLNNHPRALADLVRLDGEHVDLGTVDVLRGRERGIPRYNDFLELIGKRRLTEFAGLTGRPGLDARIREVYEGRIDDVDALVGLLGESRPPGFGFSETAYRLFAMMATRRIISDRFLADDFRPDVYTPEGMEWVMRTGMLQVLRRHHPSLAPALEHASNGSSAFWAWPGR